MASVISAGSSHDTIARISLWRTSNVEVNFVLVPALGCGAFTLGWAMHSLFSEDNMPFAGFKPALVSDEFCIHGLRGLVVSPGMKPAATDLPA